MSSAKCFGSVVANSPQAVYLVTVELYKGCDDNQNICYGRDI